MARRGSRPVVLHESFDAPRCARIRWMAQPRAIGRRLPLQLRGERPRFDDRELCRARIGSFDPVTRVGHAEQATRPARLELDEYAAMSSEPHLNVRQRLPGAARHERHAEVVRATVRRQRRGSVDACVAADVRNHVATGRDARRRCTAAWLRLGAGMRETRECDDADEHARMLLERRGRHCHLHPKFIALIYSGSKLTAFFYDTLLIHDGF
ncbi:hypothetical protein BVIET440_200096 [Burkholderia vietnamiensis]